MADSPMQQGGQQVQWQIDQSKMATHYANMIFTATTTDEMIVDFGVNVPRALPGQAPVVVCTVGTRVVLNWASAKRLAITLGNAVRQYEEQFGEISLGRQQGGPQA